MMAEWPRVMETKSVFVPNDLVSVAIQQMQLFGWTLVGQESTIYREEPCHQLRFVRELDVPYLDRIKELEEQYPFGGLPGVPISNRFGGWGKVLALFGLIFLAFGCVGTLLHLVDPVFQWDIQYPDWFSFKATVGGLIIGLVLLALWRGGTRLDTQRRAKHLRAREEVEGKRLAIEMELRELFQNSINPPENEKSDLIRDIHT
jgi:hypothetical protein